MEQREKSGPLPDFTRAPEPPLPDAGPPSEAVEIVRLISRREYKAAVARAKEHHKQLGTPESEALVVDAYLARIQDMIDHGMPVDCKALLDLVEQRYASATARTREMRLRINVQLGLLADVLCPLADPGCPVDTRNAVEKAIRCELTDLTALARCEALPPEHPLRKGASAAASALAAATSAPAAPEVVALPEISRQSPLAPWKMLIRAIAAYHQNDDASCLEHLDRVEPDSVPAKLVPALRALVTGTGEEKLGPGGSTLFSMVSGSSKSLKDSLRELDKALAGKTLGRILQAIKAAVHECSRSRPDFLETLKQHMSARAAIKRVSADAICRAMGGPPLKNASFWRLFAQVNEKMGQTTRASSLWEEFRRTAVHEKWFAPDGPEVEALYLHMAEILARLPADMLKEEQRHFRSQFEGYAAFYEDQPSSIQAVAPPKTGNLDLYFIEPGLLYQRACKLNPDPDTFERWLARATEARNRKGMEHLASMWHKARPNDSRPLLILVDLTEKRNALQKALGYLEKAERLDSLNPDVRRARFRLLVATARRHLENRKLHLLEKDFEAITALPLAEEGNRPSVLAALRCMAAAIGGDKDLEADLRREIAERLGSDLAAAVLLSGLSGACELRHLQERFLPPGSERAETRDLAAAVAEGCALGAEFGIDVAIPAGWKSRLMKELSSGDCSLSAEQVRTLTESALRQGDKGLAYQAAGLGLARGGNETARFLFLRARSLPLWLGLRRQRCLVAAADLARRHRDTALVAAVVETRRKEPGYAHGCFSLKTLMNTGDGQLSTEEIDAVVGYESEQSAYPTYKAEDIDILYHLRRQKEAQGAAGRSDDIFDPAAVEDDEFFGEEDDEEPDEDDLDRLEKTVPPRLLEMLLSFLKKFGPGGRVPDLDDIDGMDPELRDLIEAVLEERRGLDPSEPDPQQFLPGLHPAFKRSRRKRSRRR